MKKLYLLLLSLLSLPTLHAQQTDSLSLALTQVFANVDKSQVPTGLLADYALPLGQSPASTARCATPPAVVSFTVLRLR